MFLSECHEKGMGSVKSERLKVLPSDPSVTWPVRCGHMTRVLPSDPSVSDLYFAGASEAARTFLLFVAAA